MTDKTRRNRPDAVDGWLYLVNDDLDGATQRVPETLTDDDLAYHEARGWRLTDPPDLAVVPAPPTSPSGDVEFVELVHPVTGHRHHFPDHPDAIAGANEAGWVAPNKDGSIPKTAQRKAAREQGVDVDQLPSAAPDEDATEEPAGEPGAETDQQAGESSATSKGE